MAWSRWIRLHGLSGTVQEWLGSFGGLFWCSWHEEHSRQSFSMSLSILYQYTADLANCFIRCIPKCPECKSCNVFLFSASGTTSLSPIIKQPLSQLKESFNFLYCLISGFKISFGQPLRRESRTEEMKRSLSLSLTHFPLTYGLNVAFVGWLL